jgi:Domain of unknown function (DUF5658)
MTIPRPKPAGGVFRSIATGRAMLANESLLLVVLSACDLFMTYLLLWKAGHFYEANPLARFFFDRWNIAGMTAFKFGLVAIIIILCETIERHRPRVGRAIVLLGCVAALIVSLHGLRLLIGHEG